MTVSSEQADAVFGSRSAAPGAKTAEEIAAWAEKTPAAPMHRSAFDPLELEAMGIPDGQTWVDLDTGNAEGREARQALSAAAARRLMSADLDQMDDSRHAALFRASTKAIFGVEDQTGAFCFEKRAGTMRQNVERLREFLKGDYSQIETEDETGWRELKESGADEEALYRYADAKMGGKAKDRSGRAPGFFETLVAAAGKGLSGGTAGAGAAFASGQKESADAAWSENERRKDYDRLTDEEKGEWRKRTIAQYEKELAKKSPLAAFLKMTGGLSDAGTWIVANAVANGKIDREAFAALRETDPEQAEQVAGAVSAVRGDQKKGRILGVETDFTDDTWANRLQLNLYGFQQSVIGLFADTADTVGTYAKLGYMKTMLDDAEYAQKKKEWDTAQQIETAERQNLPDADGFWGSLTQGVAENAHWFIPYGLIAKGAKAAEGAAKAARLAGKTEAAIHATRVLQEGALVANDAAAMLKYTEKLRWLESAAAKLAAAVPAAQKAASLARWGAAREAGRIMAFSAFAEEYMENADARGISRTESAPTAALVGTVNALVENLYVPGLESSLAPAEVKSLMLSSAVEAWKTKGMKGVGAWIANQVEKRAVEGAKVFATEGLVEEELQQWTTEIGLQIDRRAQMLRERGEGGKAAALAAFWDEVRAKPGAATGKLWKIYAETAAEVAPSSVGFGLMTVGNMTRRQHLHNWMTRRRTGDANYDAGVVDMLEREAAAKAALDEYWERQDFEAEKRGEGGAERTENAADVAISAAREAVRALPVGADETAAIAQAAGVDMKTAEVLRDVLDAEAEWKMYSPTFRQSVNLADYLTTLDEDRVREFLPEYVSGSWMSDPENGVYSAEFKTGDGKTKRIVYRFGLSEELVKSITDGMIASGGELASSYEARRLESGDAEMKPWAELGKDERERVARNWINGFLADRNENGVFQFRTEDGQTVTVQADAVVNLITGKAGDIGYGGARATAATARHETFHALWRFAKETMSKEDIDALYSHFPDIDRKEDEANGGVALDEAMAHEFEKYASGNYVSPAIGGRMDAAADWLAKRAGGLLDALGIGTADRVGEKTPLKGFYDKVLSGKLGSGALGVEQRKIETPAPEKGGETAPKRMNAAPETGESGDAAHGTGQAEGETAGAKPETVTTSAKPEAATLEKPAASNVPGQKFYRLQAGDGVWIVGELVVSDVDDLKTSDKGNLGDASLQNRLGGKEREGRIEAIAANPNPRLMGTVNEQANGGFVWAMPNGDVFIGNTRTTGATEAYARGNADGLREYMINEAAERGIEMPDGVTKPLVHFVLRRIESKDGKATIQDVVRATNESTTTEMTSLEKARNDADVIEKERLGGAFAFRPDGSIDESKSGDAIGMFRRATKAVGLVGDATDALTKEGRERLFNALLAHFLKGADAATVEKAIGRTDAIDMKNEMSALVRESSALETLAAAKPRFDIRGAIAEIMPYYMEWLEKEAAERAKTGKGRGDYAKKARQSWSDFMAQGDMFRKPGEAARIVGDLLAASRELRSFDKEDSESDAGKARSQRFVMDYLEAYARNAAAANDETDMFGTPPATREGLMRWHRANGGAAGARFSVSLQGQREYDDVVRRYTNADGTKKHGWMKAPNGEPTKLTERQWVLVRTPAFKKWFGDWEASAAAVLRKTAATYEQGRKVLEGLVGVPLVSADGLDATLSGNSIDKIFSGKAVHKSVSFGAHLAAAANIEQLYGAARELQTDPGNKAGVKSMHRLYAPFHFGEDTLVAKISVKEYTDGTENRLYTIEAIDVEKTSAGILAPKQTVKDGESNPNADIADRIAKIVASVKGASASKNVDENGEPLVVYRGAQFDPLAQEPGKGVIKPEAYFTADPEYAKRYAGSEGAVRAYYLNIRHPFDIRDPECLKDFEKIYPGQKLARGKSGALDWAEAATIDGEFLEENFPGKYDGIIFDEASDWAPEGNLPKWRGISYVPLHGGAQVKSATDNNGDFSGHPDARYSIAGGNALATAKLGEWKKDVDEDSVRSAIADYIDRGALSGDIKLGNEGEKLQIAIAANEFFKAYSDKVVMLSDGRCAYFAPDTRNRERGHSNAECWAIYCVHAVTHGGKKVKGQSWDERIWSPEKTESMMLIEQALKDERCRAIVNDSDPSRDRVLFIGRSADGTRMDVMTSLDEYGNINADLTEVTVVMGGGNVPSTDYSPLTRAVEVVALHQADGYSVSTADSLPQLPAGVNGVAAPAVLAAAVARGEDERKAAEKKGEEDGTGSARASVAPPPRRASSPYPSLLGMSDEDLIAAALAARMATGAESSLDKTPGVSSSQTYGGIKRSTVEGFLRRVRPSASDAEIAALLDTTARKARDMAKIIRHDLAKGVSESAVAGNLDSIMRDAFGREMGAQAERGRRLGRFGAKAEDALAARQARIVADAVKNQTGVEAEVMENATGIDLAASVANMMENEMDRPPPSRSGAGEVIDNISAPLAGEDADEGAEPVQKDVSAKVKAAVDEMLRLTGEAAEKEAERRKKRKEQKAKEAEAAGEEADDGGDDGAGYGGMESGDPVAEAVRKAGVELRDPRHLALLVVEFARRHWVKEHGMAENASPWSSGVAMQFLRKTAQSVYGKLVRTITYSGGRETAFRRIAGFANIPTLGRLVNEMEFAGAIINARRIRETAQSMCEKLDQLLQTQFGATGRFKPDDEELRRRAPAEMELRARYMRHAMWLTPDACSREAEELAKELAAVQSEFDSAGSDAEKSRVYADVMRKVGILREFGGLKYKKLADIEAALQWWQDAAEGSFRQQCDEWTDRETRTQRLAAALAAAFRNPKLKKAAAGKGLAQTFGDYFHAHCGFTNLLRDLMRFAGEKERADAERVVAWLELEIQKAGTRAMTERRKSGEEFKRAVERIYGKKWEDAVKLLNAEDARFDKFMGEADDGVRVTATRARAMQLYASLVQTGRLVRREDPENPNQWLLVWEGGYHDNIVENHREGQAEEIAKLLTAEDMNLLAWMRQWYERNRQGLSDVSTALFGVGVYAETGNYMPVKMLVDPQGFEKPGGAAYAFFPKSLTPRIRNKRDFDTSADVLTMWGARMEEAAQWKAHAELGLELRGIFGRTELQKAIVASHGAKAKNDVLAFITDILAGHGNADGSADGAKSFVDTVRGWAALGALGGNLGVMLKQTTSIPAFGFEIGLRKTFSHMATALTPEGIAAMKKLLKSEERVNRWTGGNTEEVSNALNDSTPGALKKLLIKSMVTNRVGDIVPALVVGQGIFRECVHQGMSEEDAMAYTWMLVERTQQSSRVENRSAFQRRGKLGNIIYQFLTTQQQYLQYELRALREIAADPKNAKKWGGFLRAAVLNHFIPSSAYYGMGELYKALLGQEPPEDRLADWMVAMLTGPYGAMYGIGLTTADALRTYISGPRANYGKGRNPIPALAWLENVWIKDPALIIWDTFDGKKTWDDVLDDMGRWIGDFNATLRDIRKIYKYRVKDEPQRRR